LNYQPDTPPDGGGFDRRWIWPLAALGVAGGIILALVIAFVATEGGDDDDDDSVEVPSATETATVTPSETPSATPTETATEEPTPTPTEGDDDDDDDNDGGDDDSGDDDDDGGDDDDVGNGDPAVLIEIDEEASAAGDNVVYLTFDAGSDRGFAEDILDYLAAEEIVASFGITGQWAEENPDLVERLLDDGHELFNHTYSHRSFTGFSSGEEPLSEEERREEITRADEIYESIAGVDGKPFWRPPFGDIDDAAPAQVGSLGYRAILKWTIDSLGWDGLSEQEITDRVLGQMEPGAIVLFHVGSASQDFAALDDIVEALREQDYRFASVNELP
jgi:peptidoglycan/xylan/chitin deacetylase (PgdA/CDA1 family)